MTDFHLGNAVLLRNAVAKLSFTSVSGINAPYSWINVGRDS